MNVLILLEKINNVHGLITVLRDMLWNVEGITKQNKREMCGILALIETIEQGSTEIHNIYEQAIEIN